MDDLKKDNPNTSFPLEISNKLLAEFDVYPVKLVNPPTINSITQTLTEKIPKFINDEWTQIWDISNATNEEIIERKNKKEQEYAAAIQKHIDTIAQSKKYTDGVSLASYDSSTISSWAAEAQAFVAWRDSVWSYAFIELEKVKNGLKPQPTIEEIIAELPIITWP